jgi:O-antigen/teichoic acid export membrane protein
MDNKTALNLSYAILVLSLVALVMVMAAFVLHLQVPAIPFRILMVVAYLWPAAAFSIAFFRKRLSGKS